MSSVDEDAWSTTAQPPKRAKTEEEEEEENRPTKLLIYRQEYGPRGVYAFVSSVARLGVKSDLCLNHAHEERDTCQAIESLRAIRKTFAKLGFSGSKACVHAVDDYLDYYWDNVYFDDIREGSPFVDAVLGNLDSDTIQEERMRGLVVGLKTLTDHLDLSAFDWWEEGGCRGRLEEACESVKEYEDSKDTESEGSYGEVEEAPEDQLAWKLL